MREYSKSSTKSAKSKSPFLHLVESGKPVKLFIHSNDPDYFADDEISIPSIAAELTHNYRQYKPEEATKSKWIKIPCSPRLLAIANTIRQQVGFSRPPGINPTLCCAASLGINQLLARRAIRQLGELSNQFQKTKKQGTPLEMYIHSFFESRVDSMIDNGRPRNIELMLEVKNQIDMISMDTGLLINSVTLLAIYAAFVQQEETPPDFKREWQEHIDNSIATLDCKLDMAKVIMRNLKTQNERFA